MASHYFYWSYLTVHSNSINAKKKNMSTSSPLYSFIYSSVLPDTVHANSIQFQ